MPPMRDLTGQRFTRLLVISRSGLDKSGGITWLCRCDCGQTKVIHSGWLVRGAVKSCGCLHRELAGTKTIRQRGENNPNWKGGRTNHRGYVRLRNPDYPGAEN